MASGQDNNKNKQAPMSDAVDLKHLDQYVCGDTALLDEILSIFIDQADGWMAKLSANMSDDDWHHSCHALKGASRGVGAWAVGDIAERGEALTGDAADVENARRRLLEELRRETARAIAFAKKTRG